MIVLAILLAAQAADAPLPAPPAAPRANGAIFQSSQGYVPLTDGHRAGRVGDILTVVLVERTQGSATAATGTDRDASLGLTPPTTGPLSLINPSDVAMGGTSNFAGRGQSSQGNSLSGEIAVTVTEVLPNGLLRVSGEKRVRINRGDETVRVSGVVRPSDIGVDNRIASTRIADAAIHYGGRGEVARASRQGWLQRFFSMISPF